MDRRIFLINNQTPSTNNQIMTKISINEIAPHPFPLPSGERIKVRGSFGHWILFGAWDLGIGI
ncbi:MAG: hypothetical protein FJ115_10845 [Deltaproteobacteria bacterium]|nr:hypothetical protein [Deltaproteobacteria bacterium]